MGMGIGAEGIEERAGERKGTRWGKGNRGNLVLMGMKTIERQEKEIGGKVEGR
jgi:hypothetical protein